MATSKHPRRVYRDSRDPNFKMEVRTRCSTTTPYHAKHGPTINKLPHCHPSVLKVRVEAAHVLAMLDGYYSPESLIRSAKNNPPGRHWTHRGSYRRCHVDDGKETNISFGPLLTPKRLLPLSVKAALLISALVCVRAEEVSLSLREILREVRRAVAIKIAKRCRESNRWNSP